MLDKKISKEEKIILKQLSIYLGMDRNIDDLIKKYKKDMKKQSGFPIKTFILGMLFLLVISAGLYWKYIQISQNKKYFEKGKVVFSEIYFNRFVIYQNSSHIESQYFTKLTVYYLSGTVDVSFDANDIKYDSLTNTLTLYYKKPYIFKTTVNLENSVEVDRKNPKEISEEEASNVAAVVGFASGVIGAKVGSKLIPIPEKFSFLSKFPKLVGGAIGAGIASGAGYYFTNKALKGLSLSQDISQEERAEVIYTAKQLINYQMNTDDELSRIYKKSFEEFIKAEFKKHSMEVKTIKYIGSIK